MHVSPRALRGYVGDELPPAEGARVHAHLVVCEECRGAHDREVLLLRALAGNLDEALHAENRRTQRRVHAALFPDDNAGSRRPANWLAWMLDWPRYVQLGGALAAAAVLVFLALPASVPPRALVARVVAFQGSVLVDGTLAEGQMPIRDNAFIQVSSKGPAQLSLVDGGVVRVFPGTSLRISSNGADMELVEGAVWCTIQRRPDEFRVRTQHAVAVVRGTSFIVERRADRDTEVRVVSGHVRVQSVRRDGGAVDVREGQKTTVGATGALRAASPYDPRADRNEWEKFVKVLKDALNEGIRQIRDQLIPE